MKLRDFLELFVRHNSLIRLWTTVPEKHTMIVGPNGEEVGMDWGIKDRTGWQSAFSNREVFYIADILCENYREAINIVIKPTDYTMTGADRLRSMNDEELAVANVRRVFICDDDEGWNEYVTSDEERFEDERKAVEHELDWLRRPVEED